MTHEEVIKILREVHDNALFSIRTALETICPELRESEDERIREDIIGGIMWQRDNLKSEGPHDNNLILPGFCLTVGEQLAYLEKQREATPETCLKGIFDFDDISQLELAVNCYKEKKGHAYPVTVEHQHEVLMKLYDLIGIDREALDQDKDDETD